ncbi:MAG TPA: divalent-cation tolerance protein CutA [Candidatus Angelobacter sp.]|jgi:periplasmic divalent cation tolerance protein|nr:divalent-cation tolerance protein CutA [Candidatus Angelobacter sp.]
MNQACIILTTAGSREEARKIAHFLVEQQFAACVNVVPHIESVYRWKGKVERAEEWLLVIKTTDTNFSQVQDEIKKLHSYDLPECIKLDVSGGSEEYLKWIGESLRIW